MQSRKQMSTDAKRQSNEPEIRVKYPVGIHLLMAADQRLPFLHPLRLPYHTHPQLRICRQ